MNTKTSINKLRLSLYVFLILLAQFFVSKSFAAPLIEPADLVSQWQNVENGNYILLDIRTDPLAIKDLEQRAVYQQLTSIDALKFVAGSFHIPYAQWRSTDTNNPGKLIAEEAIEKNIQSLGYEPGDKIIILHQGHDQTDFGAAARVYWTLKTAGIENISILNGGFLGLKNLGQINYSNTPQQAKSSSFKLVLNTKWLSTTDSIQTAQNSPGEHILLDARTESQFLGEEKHPAAKKYGTIPNAQLLTNFSWFDDKGKFKTRAEILAIAEQNNLLNSQQEIHSFCNTGHWAATNWFVLSEILNIADVSLYPGSFVEYASLEESRVANEPSRLVYFWRELFN